MPGGADAPVQRGLFTVCDLESRPLAVRTLSSFRDVAPSALESPLGCGAGCTRGPARRRRARGCVPFRRSTAEVGAPHHGNLYMMLTFSRDPRHTLTAATPAETTDREIP